MCDSKRCKKCNEVKPVTEFYAASTMKDGRMNICKVCHREISRRNNREYRKDPEYRAKMNEESKRINKERYHNDPEYRELANKRASEYVKERYATDPEFRQKMKDRAKQQRKKAAKAAVAEPALENKGFLQRLFGKNDK